MPDLNTLTSETGHAEELRAGILVLAVSTLMDLRVGCRWQAGGSYSRIVVADSRQSYDLLTPLGR